MLCKLERAKGMIVGFGFLGLALLLKSVYPGNNIVVIGMILVIMTVGPNLLSYSGKLHKQKLVKT